MTCLLRKTTAAAAALLFGLMLWPAVAAAQTCDRIMAQDTTLNNLIQPAGYKTCAPSTLGAVEKYGHGDRTAILIPGLGFGAAAMKDLAVPRLADFTMYAVTLPGFAGTQAPPWPEAGTSFGDQTWTNNAQAAIETLIRTEGLQDVVLVGHWLTGTQLALRLALAYPDLVSGVVVISGSTRFTPTDTTQMPAHPELPWRIAGIDRYMAPMWFKTVTRETWDDNNFIPADYAVNPVRGLRLWREAARPELSVWIRYLCEFYAQDVSLELGRLDVPTLVLIPGLEEIYHDPGNNYMVAYCRRGWDGAALTNPKITLRTIPGTRVFMWYDQPEVFDSAFDAFLASLTK